jgi:hypothetical protein
MKFTKIDIPEDRRIEATKWTREFIGRAKGENGELHISEIIWYKTSLPNGIARFYFRDPKHATLFSLRWQ